MKKKINIDLTLPATISDFSQDLENEQFTRAKLKVCHNQETEDKRYFSDSCREKLFKTLPYTPIVSRFDEESDDFKGHAAEQQIFGIVDPCRDYTFETDEQGREWCVCDVVLYTERPDSVGKIAQKIVGHSHSLELDPKSVKYEILYDEKKHLKRIEFTDAKFIGLSVLGEKQKPAFSGSVFFNYDESFEEKMKLLKDYCESNKEGEVKQNMDYQSFMKLSFGEIFEKADKVISAKYDNDGFIYIRDIYSDSVVFEIYYNTGDKKLLQINYELFEDGTMTLNEESVREVRPVYEVVETNEPASGFDTEEEEEVKEEEKDIEEEEKEEDFVSEETSTENNPVSEDMVTEETPEEVITEASEITEATEVAEVVETTEENFTTTEEVSEKEEDEQKSVQEESNTATLSESERAEFENLKREKKVNLLNSYKNILTDEEYNNFNLNIDNYEANDLELELLKKYKENSMKVTEEKPIRAFAYKTVLDHNNNKDEDPVAAFIRQSKNNRR